MKYREIVEGGIYHIIQRAPGKELLFLEDNDYLYFLSRLKKSSKEFELDIFCFALLPNHLHILLKINKKNLQEAMKFLFQGYAQYFNGKYKRKGHVFYGRYKSNLCNDDRYLIAVSLYIHLNPFKAGLSSSPFDYKWSSVSPYIKQTKTTFLDTEFILSILNEDKEKAQNSYCELLKVANEKIEYENIIRSSSAIKNFFKNFMLIKELKEKIKFTFLENYDKFSWVKLEAQIEKFKDKKRIAKPEERRALAYLIKQLLATGYTIKEVAEKLDMHRVSVYRLMQRFCS